MNNDQNRDYGQSDPNPQHHFYVENEKENPIEDSSGNQEDDNQIPDPHHSPEDDRDYNSQDLHPAQNDGTTAPKGNGDSSVASGTNADRYSKEAYDPTADAVANEETKKEETKDKDSPAFRTPGL
eukprot:GILI01072774.1.p1 GENE.GILI01072774.1~~GILI01072774.1.p1  ORF type:complete len:143 (-),score=9.87 GILI01072774.1:21-395(-)